MMDKCAETMTEEWRDTYKVGTWLKGEAFDFDLRSSYPSLMANLPDLTNAEFFNSDTIPENYTWGELLGDVIVTKDVSPFLYQVNGTDCYPKGILKNKQITTDYLWLLKKYGGDFKMSYGWFFRVPKLKFPFRPLMTQLYKMREHENQMVGEIAKAISVGVWGMLCQRYPKAENLKTKEVTDWKLGDNFNSIYGRMVSSRCSIKVADFIYRNQLDPHVISVTVDGLLAEKPVEISGGKVMGGWKRNDPDKAIIVSQLYQWLGDKKPNGKTCEEMVEMITKNPKSSVYENVDLNLSEHKRIFPKLPRSGGELLNGKYESNPAEVR
jgi:hypothetical protein